MQQDLNILQVDNLSKYFGGLAAVSNCSLKIKKGSITGIIGPNGSGKTTTIGKLAARYKAQGDQVMLAAGDTFRAAATEQLQALAKRVDVPCVSQKSGADPSAVADDAV